MDCRELGGFFLEDRVRIISEGKFKGKLATIKELWLGGGVGREMATLKIDGDEKNHTADLNEIEKINEETLNSRLECGHFTNTYGLIVGDKVCCYECKPQNMRKIVERIKPF